MPFQKKLAPLSISQEARNVLEQVAHSDPNWTPIPDETKQLNRCKIDTDADLKLVDFSNPIEIIMERSATR